MQPNVSFKGVERKDQVEQLLTRFESMSEMLKFVERYKRGKGGQSYKE